jgi:hypothetical protein
MHKATKPLKFLLRTCECRTIALCITLHCALHAYEYNFTHNTCSTRDTYYSISQTTITFVALVANAVVYV